MHAEAAEIQKLIAAHGQDPEVLSVRSGKNSPKRGQQISKFLETLNAIGQF